jgi:hypothetical protein
MPVPFDDDEWEWIYGKYDQLTSTYSSNDEVGEMIRREDEIWKLLQHKQVLRSSTLADSSSRGLMCIGRSRISP